jgi:hypothetical protein
MSREEQPGMDEAAKAAEQELLEHFDQWSARAIAKWWAKWYMTAGHKRLGRLLVSLNEKHQWKTAGQ